MVFLILIAVALIVWLALTWWNTPESKTFKAVVQDAVRDVWDIIGPFCLRVWGFAKRVWVFIGPRVTNVPTLAVVLLDVYATATPEMREIIASDHRLAAVLLALNLVSRLSPRNAPQRIPAPVDSPSGGLVNEAAIR